MSIDLGDVLPLSVSITDENGVLANAGNVALSITLPDSTVVNQASIAPDSTGIYKYDYPTTQVGRHTLRWLATGVNACAFTDMFYVTPVDGGDFISLAQLKSHMRKTDTNSDELLRGFVSASCAVLTDRMGKISPTSLVEDRTVIRDFINLESYPVISVSSVSVLPGLSSVTAGNEGTGTQGWLLLDPDTGQMHVPHCGRVRISYTAGLTVIPQNYILAALELALHLWRNSQQNAGGGRPPVGLDETVVPGVSYALPFNVRQLLGLDKRNRSQVFIS